MASRKEILESNRRFFGKWAASYNLFAAGWAKVIQKKTISHIKGKRISILDIGCGTGKALEIMKNKFPNARIYGIDLSKKMLAKAKTLLGKNVQLKEASADKLPFNANKFDYILCTSAFHHFPKQLNALKEMKRVLRKDGLLLLADENFFLFNKIIKNIEPGHVKMNSKKEMKQLIENAGLRLISQKRILLFVILNICAKKV